MRYFIVAMVTYCEIDDGLFWYFSNCSPYGTTVKIGGNRQEELRNEIIEKNTQKNYFLVNFSRFLSSLPISGLHFNELLI